MSLQNQTLTPVIEKSRAGLPKKVRSTIASQNISEMSGVNKARLLVEALGNGASEQAQGPLDITVVQELLAEFKTTLSSPKSAKTKPFSSPPEPTHLPRETKPTLKPGRIKKPRISTQILELEHPAVSAMLLSNISTGIAINFLKEMSTYHAQRATLIMSDIQAGVVCIPVKTTWIVEQNLAQIPDKPASSISVSI